MIKTVAQITSVERRTTKAGKSFAVVFDIDGKEYTSWADPLTVQAEGLQGSTVQLGFDETTSKDGRYTNRTLRFLQEAGNSGDSYAGRASEPESVSDHVPTPRVPVSVDSSANGEDGDWLQVVRNTARRGEWRAAEALQRREDIARAVALNNTITFFQYLAEDNRKPENVKLIFEYMLKALNDA